MLVGSSVLSSCTRRPLLVWNGQSVSELKCDLGWGKGDFLEDTIYCREEAPPFSCFGASHCAISSTIYSAICGYTFLFLRGSPPCKLYINIALYILCRVVGWFQPVVYLYGCLLVLCSSVACLSMHACTCSQERVSSWVFEKGIGCVVRERVAFDR